MKCARSTTCRFSKYQFDTAGHVISIVSVYRTMALRTCKYGYTSRWQSAYAKVLLSYMRMIVVLCSGGLDPEAVLVKVLRQDDHEDDIF